MPILSLVKKLAAVPEASTGLSNAINIKMKTHRQIERFDVNNMAVSLI
jgi:hypothetical protein